MMELRAAVGDLLDRGSVVQHATSTLDRLNLDLEVSSPERHDEVPEE